MAYKPKILALIDGGTNASLTASNGGIFYSTASAGAVLSGTSTANQILMSGASTTPTWSTATYPVTAGTAGNVLTSDGTNWNSTALPASSGIITVTGQLTSAQIKALHGTPITILSTPGSNKFLKIISFTASYVYGGNNAFTAAASQVVGLYYGTTSLIANGATNAQLTGTSSTLTSSQNLTLNVVTTTSYANQALNWYNSVATEISGNAAGDNVINWSITYLVVSV